MRLIDADALIEVVEKSMAENPHKDKMQRGMHTHEHKYFLTLLAGAPTIQPEPQEGHWIPHESPDGGEQYECSECGVLWEFNDGTPEDNEAYYCPKCGKKLITK